MAAEDASGHSERDIQTVRLAEGTRISTLDSCLTSASPILLSLFLSFTYQRGFIILPLLSQRPGSTLR